MTRHRYSEAPESAAELFQRMMTYDLSRFSREPIEEYEAQASRYLTSSKLVNFRKRPGAYYRLRLDDGRRRELERQETSDTILGRAVHVLVTEGSAEWKKRYVTGGPINPKTGRAFGRESKAFQEWEAEAQWPDKDRRPCLTRSESLLVRKMAKAVRADAEAAELLSYGMPEAVLRSPYCGIPCQIRCDWFNPHRGIVELKTTRHIGRLWTDCMRYGYITQMAFHQAVYTAASPGKRVPPVYLIGVEKDERDETRQVAVWEFDEVRLWKTRLENRAAIERFAATW